MKLILNLFILGKSKTYFSQNQGQVVFIALQMLIFKAFRLQIRKNPNSEKATKKAHPKAGF
jgi:hypothetical protein